MFQMIKRLFQSIFNSQQSLQEVASEETIDLEIDPDLEIKMIRSIEKDPIISSRQIPKYEQETLDLTEHCLSYNFHGPNRRPEPIPILVKSNLFFDFEDLYKIYRTILNKENNHSMNIPLSVTTYEYLFNHKIFNIDL
jgi:hypothetical protein